MTILQQTPNKLTIQFRPCYIWILGGFFSLLIAATSSRPVCNKLDFSNILLARLYPKLRTWFSLSGKNPGFLANIFSISQIIDEDKKVKLLFHIGFSLGDRVAKKWIKSSLGETLNFP